MGNQRTVICLCAVVALTALTMRISWAQQKAPEPQSPAVDSPTKHAAEKRSKAQRSDTDSNVPSPSEYPFSEALRKLQSENVAKPSRSKAIVPPLAVMPIPPQGPRSKDLPKDYVPKKDVALSSTGVEAVSVSREWQEAQNIPAPGKDGRVLYIYGAGMPVVVCSPLRICVVELEPGEKLVGEPHVGDSVRWEISPASAGNGETAMPLIVIKPTAAGLDTTMMVPTDRRAYYFRLQSKPDEYLARVAFSYPENQDEQWKVFQQQQDAARAKKPEPANTKVLPDAVDIVYWDYAIKGGVPTLRPSRVLDDGTKTYIQMPPVTGKTEAPVLVIHGLDGGELVNYRVKGDIYVVDRIFNRAALIVGTGKHARKVEIIRKVPIGEEKQHNKDKEERAGQDGGL
jgi:P-type conjugative transfer protein TrbG